MGKEKAEVIAKHELPGVKTASEVIFDMELIASESRCKEPVYHLKISWDANDMSDNQRKIADEGDKDKAALETVTNDEMIMVAQRHVDALGLSEHQWIAVRHRDTANPHIHIVANRVHPDTGKTWKGWRDCETIEQTNRTLEREFGWREVPGRSALMPGHEIPPRRKTTKAGWHSNKKKGLPPPTEGQSPPDKFILSLEEHGKELTMPPHLPQNVRQLRGCWKRAVGGDAHCQWQMGEIYRLGAGVQPDASVAMAWYELAQEQGHSDATSAYARLAQKGFTPTDFPRSLPWGDGVDSDWHGIVGRDRDGDDYGLEDRGLDHRLQR